MSKLFEQTSIKSLSFANRFVRSAAWEGMAETDGSCSPKLIDLMVKLAEGGVGLIITGHAYVSREGQAGPWQMGAYSEAMLPGLSLMAEAVHRAGGKLRCNLPMPAAMPFPKFPNGGSKPVCRRPREETGPQGAFPKRDPGHL